MMSRRMSIFCFVAVVMCACLIQEAATRKQPIRDFLRKETQGQEQSAPPAEGSQKWNPFEPYTKAKRAAPTADGTSENAFPSGGQPFLWNPLKFILRLIAIITYPPRFIIRFFFTFAAVFFLVLFNCQVIPEVDCGLPVRDMIPGIMDGLREELNFYASLAKDGGA